MNTKKAILFATLVALAAFAVPSTLAYGYGSSGYPPYGEYWGYDWGRSNYISPPVYLSYRGNYDNCITGVRSAYWGGFLSCNGYQGNNVRPWSGGGAYSSWGGRSSYGSTYRSWY